MPNLSQIYFELIFVYGVRKVFNLFFCTWIFSCSSIIYWTVLAPLVEPIDHNVGVHFWALSFNRLIYVYLCPYARTTLSWLLWFCSNFLTWKVGVLQLGSREWANGRQGLCIVYFFIPSYGYIIDVGWVSEWMNVNKWMDVWGTKRMK